MGKKRTPLSSASKSSPEYWIVTYHPFFEHATPEAAATEAARLKSLTPSKDFRVIRCKRHVEQNSALHAAARDLLEACQAIDAFWCEDWTPPETADERRILTPECVALWVKVREAIAKATGDA